MRSLLFNAAYRGCCRLFYATARGASDMAPGRRSGHSGAPALFAPHAWQAMHGIAAGIKVWR